MRVNKYETAGRRRRRRSLWTAGMLAFALLAAAGGWTWHESAGPGGSHGGAQADLPTSAPASSPAALTPDPSPSPSAPARIVIGWAGDTTPGSKYGLPPDQGRALFAPLRDELRAPDLMILNLEGTYSTPGPSKCDGVDSAVCFAFQAPPSYAEALPWAGVDLVSLANNHSHDFLERGLQQTVTALERNDVAWTGLRGRTALIKVGGARVAVLGFAPYAWTADLLDIPAAARLVRRAADRADLVIVLMHVGAEGARETRTPTGSETAFGENRGDPRAFAHAVVAAGADVVFGSGPHVVRGIERYRGRLIAYSLGNFAGWGNFATAGVFGLSGLLTVELDADGGFHGGRWLSVRLTGQGVPTADPSHASARLVSELSSSDFRSTFRIDRKGRISKP